MRSSVLMCPPVDSVVANDPGRRHRARNEQWLPLWTKREPAVTHARACDLSPDRTRRPVVQGGRCGWETMRAGLRLVDRSRSRWGRSGTDRSTPKTSGSFRRRANPAQRSPRPSWTRASRQPAASRAGRRPRPRAVPGRRCRRPGPRRRPGRADCAASLRGGPGPVAPRGSTRPGVSVPVKASSASRPSAPVHQHRRHVAGLVVGEAVLVVLHLAEHGDHRHQQPGVLERQRARRRTSPASSAYAARAAPTAASGVGRCRRVTGEPGVGDCVVPRRPLLSLVRWTDCGTLEAWTTRPGRH